jgi:hypothetical protein
MRYSPYDMSDYGLQHAGGFVSPLNMPAYSEGAWNLYWASIPELDRFLDVPYEDFDKFREECKNFPFARKVKVDQLLYAVPLLLNTLETEDPITMMYILRGFRNEVDEIVRIPGWLEGVEARLTLAQTLVDTKEAAAVCSSVVAVDFKARRRM